MASLRELGKKDRMILSELDRNCRQSNAEIARKLKLGKHVVSYRIAQLEKSGAIKGYYSVIDMSCLGWQSYRIYLRLRPMGEEKYSELKAHIVDSKSTWWVGEMDGEWDVGMVVWFPGHSEFEEFWRGFSGRFQPFIEESRVSVYLRFTSLSYSFLTGRARGRKEYVIGEGKKKKVDEKDLKVLSVVSGRARLGTLEIARETGLTPVQVSYRLKKLVKAGVIKGFRANVSLEDLALYKADFRLRDTSRKKEMFAFAQNEKWAAFVDESIGFADFELEVLCPNYREFREITRRFKSKFASEVTGYRFEIYSRVLKIRYF